MLEDDLKLSSDEEEGEQVSSRWALCCSAWHRDADLAGHPGRWLSHTNAETWGSVMLMTLFGAVGNVC